jgi:thiamine transport system permease protein
MISWVLFFFLVIFFIFPYLLLFHEGSGLSYTLVKQVLTDNVGIDGSLVTALSNSFIQGLVTSIVGLTLGIVLFLALYSAPRFVRSWAFLLSLPFLLPPLYSLSVYFTIFKSASYGNMTVGFVQGFVLSGYIALSFWWSYQKKAFYLEKVAFVFGVSPFSYWGRLWGLFLKEGIIFFLSGFILGFTSFAIPLVLGGVSGVNTEVFLYEKLRQSSSHQEVLIIALLPFIVMVGLDFFRVRMLSSSPKEDFFLSSSSGRDVPKGFSGNSFFSVMKGLKGGDSPFGVGFLWMVLPLYMGIFLSPLFLGLTKGLWALMRVPGWESFFYSGLRTSLFLMIMGFLCFFFFLNGVGIISLYSRKLFLSWVLFPVSPAVLAIAFWSKGYTDHIGLLCYAYLVILSPFLIRFGFEAKLAHFETQIEMSLLLGRSFLTTWVRIIYPQLQGYLMLLSSIGAVWVLLDFAIIRLFFSEAHGSLASTAQSFLSSYRYYESQGLVALLTLIGLIFLGGTYFAFHRNSSS